MLTSLSVETLPLELRPLIHAASPTIHITRSQKKKKKKHQNHNNLTSCILASSLELLTMSLPNH